MGGCISCAIVRADREERKRQLDMSHPSLRPAEVQRREHFAEGALPEEGPPRLTGTIGALPEDGFVSL